MQKPRPARTKPITGTTPEEVLDFIRDVPEGKAPTADPAMGVRVLTAARPEPEHPLVIIGDSLSHGFQHGTIHNTNLAWGAILATAMGVEDRFRTPDFSIGGGLPADLEGVARAFDAIDPLLPARRLIRSLWSARAELAMNYRLWTRGPGRIGAPQARPGVHIHNLAQFGFDLIDAVYRTEATERARYERPSRFRLLPIVKKSDRHSTIRVLSQVHDDDGTPLSVTDGARYLGKHGGIGTLVVALGANNALGAVEHLHKHWSGPGFDDLDDKEDLGYTVWRPEHFRASYLTLLRTIRSVNADRVVLCTVPHVTVAPIARGVKGYASDTSPYFNFYTRPWINQDAFNPAVDQHLTAQDAHEIDATIDLFNRFIEEQVREARRNGRDWYVFDLAGLLDRMATRRYIHRPQAQPSWWTPADVPDELVAAAGELDTRFLRTEPDPDRPGHGRRTMGGWIGLDGIHPTTMGYAYMAWQAANLLRTAGVPFRDVGPDGTVTFDWARWFAADTVLSAPPASVNATLARIGQADQLLDRVLHPGTDRSIPRPGPALGR